VVKVSTFVGIGETGMVGIMLTITTGGAVSVSTIVGLVETGMVGEMLPSSSSSGKVGLLDVKLVAASEDENDVGNAVGDNTSPAVGDTDEVSVGSNVPSLDPIATV
jgi:hypothetical protein